MSIASVLLATVATQVFGTVWYGLLSEPWMRGIGRQRADLRNAGSGPFIQAGLAMLTLSAFMSATLRPFFGVVTLEEAIHFALRVSVAGALLQVPHKAFEGKGWSTYLVNLGYDMACLLIVCVMTTIM